MASYPNIESRKFPGKDYYVGYGANEIWHVRRAARRAWLAQLVSLNRKPMPMVLQGSTLGDISRQLAALT